MQRSRSRSGLIETAFVGGGASCSSAEDLDDLDRLANHPVLRSKNAASSSSNSSNATSYRQRWERARAAPGLRKSRSESGEVLLGGWGALDYPSPSASFSGGGAAAASAAAADAVAITADASVSNQASPTADSVSSGVAAASAQLPPRPRSGRDSVPGFSSSGRVLGRRAMAAMASRFGRLTRSATAAGPADFYQSSRSVPGPPGSPANSTTSATSSWVFHHHHSRVQQQQQQQQQQQHHQHFHHHFAQRQFHYLRHQRQQQLSRSAPSTPPTWSEVKIDAIGGEGGGSPAAGSTVSEQQQQRQNPKDQRLQHQKHQMQVVRAVIENATTPTTHRDFASSLTPPPNTAQKYEPSEAAADPAAVSTATPPNTAPLPAKFGRLSVMPHNLLKSKHGGGVGQERISSAAVVDSSEDGSINDITQADVDDKELEEEEEEEEPKAKPKSRFSLSLRSRLQMDSKAVGDRDGGDSSSAESTPDRRAKQQEQQQQMHQKKRPSLPIKGMVIRRGAEAKPSKLHFGQQKVPPPLLPKPIQDLSKPSAAATGGAKSKFFSSGESSCSSAMSSMESVRSNASDGVHSMVSSESGGQASSGASGVGGSVVPGGRFAVGIGIGIGVGGASSMSCSEAGSEASSSSLATPPPPQSAALLQQQRRPTLELRQGKHAVGLSKFQVLSPISDKSQEQYSEQSDNNRTPKVSPTTLTNNSNSSSNTTTPAAATAATADMVDNLNNNNAESSEQKKEAVDNDNGGDDVREALAVPWEVPKLRRRLQNLNEKQQRRRTTIAGGASGASAVDQLRGSDSGISMASQDVAQEMRDLLNVPWDMPKLRKRTQQQEQQQQPMFTDAPAANAFGGRHHRPHSMPVCPFPSSADNQNAKEENEERQPENNDLDGTPPSLPPPQSGNKELVLSLNAPPPPPGFEDSEDEYYLQGQRQQQQQQQQQQQLLARRRQQRPQMTLSFGVDPSLNKTLMFATNSPFALNDCEEVDPSMPLDRQDWYHGATSRKEAENILRSNKEGTYLVRKVDAGRQEYALSLKSAKGFMHMKIRRDPHTRDFQLSDFERRFLTVPQMVHHYTRNRLPIKGAEHMCLKKPLREQLL